jgi:hypothetical protein
MIAWRTVAHRPQVSAWRVNSLYFHDMAYHDYNKRLIDFCFYYYNLGPEHTRDVGLFPYGHYLTELDETGWRQFGLHFGGDYLLRAKSEKTLDLPVAFENECFLIYRLRP